MGIVIMNLDDILDDSAKKAYDNWKSLGRRTKNDRCRTKNASTALDDILDDSAKKAYDNWKSLG